MCMTAQLSSRNSPSTPGEGALAFVRAPSRLCRGDVVAALCCHPSTAELVETGAVFAQLIRLVDGEIQVELLFTGDEGGAGFIGTRDPGVEEQAEMLRDLARQSALRVVLLDSGDGRKIGTRTVRLTQDFRNGILALLTVGRRAA